MSDSEVGPNNPQLIDLTAGLARYLRDLVRNSRKPVRDLARYDEVVWLSVVAQHVAADLSQDRVAGSDVLVLPFEPKAPAPEPPPILLGLVDSNAVHDPLGPEPGLAVDNTQQDPSPETTGQLGAVLELEARSHSQQIEAAYEAWIVRWRAWSAQRRAALPRQQLHEKLTAIAHSGSEQDDVFEAVLAAGLLTLQPAQGGKIRRHLLTRRIQIRIDQTARITVRLDADAPMRLEDRDFLHDEPDYKHSRASGIHERLADCFQDPLAEQAQELVEDWCRLALDHAVRFSAEWEPVNGPADPPNPCLLSWSPAIILRRRGGSSLAEIYDKIATDLARPGAQVPLSLAQVVAPLTADERASWNPGGTRWSTSQLVEEPLFPLPANSDQREVLKKLQTNTAVVVQGPPGTGKTHTIANLTSALLAQGKRVLVTSQKDQALQVLREKIPAELRDLCVLLTSYERVGPSALERTLGAMSDNAASMRPESLQSEIRLLDERRERLLRRRAVLEEGIRERRLAESRVHEPAPGYRGTMVDLDYLIAQDLARYGWMPLPPAAAPGELPLGVGMFGRLRDLLRTIEPDHYARIDQHMPDPEDVLDPDGFATLLGRIESLSLAVGELDATSHAVARLNVEGLAVIEALVHRAAGALHELGLEVSAKRWPSNSWESMALADALGGRSSRLWARLAETAADAEAGLDSVEALNPPVSIPDLQPDERGQFLAAARAWRDHLRSGGRARGRFLRSDAQSRAEPFLKRCMVAGVVPSSGDEELSAIITVLEAETVSATIAEQWRSVDLCSESGSLAHRLERQIDRARSLKHVAEFAAIREEIERELLRHGVRVVLSDPKRWDAFTAAIGAARNRIYLEADIATFDALLAVLSKRTSPPSAPEIADLQAAVTTRDPTAYANAHATFTTGCSERAAVLETRRLINEVRTSHSGLARMIADDPHHEQWNDLPQVARAWAWAVAARFAESHHVSDHANQSEIELSETEERLLKVAKELAGAKAWLHCLSRLNQPQRQALAQLRSHLGSIGSGDGRYASRALAAARDAMKTAQGAVPAWVMPLYQVVETLPAEPDSFDVVIVDEASQVGIDGLFLLCLAPRMIVVGDNKQCVPSYGGGEHQKVYLQAQEHLAGIPRAQRHMFAPGMNLYELLSTCFPDTIRLTEHFRCMPEIIGWCSDQFYDRSLRPLRQYGPDRLDPLRVEFVHGAYPEGRSDNMYNPIEAKQIVSKLQELLADPRYEGLTFGIITLRGTAQAQQISKLVAENIDPPTIVKHKIRIGTPADFQGDERDVVLLSMVTTKGARLVRGTNDQRRFNVAASRASDQLWLFTSIAADQFKSDDLRLSLLSYMLSPPPVNVHQPIPILTGVTEQREHEAFDTLFEQRVYLRIKARGYLVAPQVKVGRKRIDLVVYGSHSSLAVECDGDYWHGDIDTQLLDIRREQELVRAGWQFWRIGESKFARDPDAALEPLWTALEARGIAPQRDDDGNARVATWQPIDLPDTDPDDENEAEDEGQ